MPDTRAIGTTTVTVYDGLDSDSAAKALSANQGRILDGKITDLSNDIITNEEIDTIIT